MGGWKGESRLDGNESEQCGGLSDASVFVCAP